MQGRFLPAELKPINLRPVRTGSTDVTEPKLLPNRN